MLSSYPKTRNIGPGSNPLSGQAEFAIGTA
jgi:hypothetical protein